MLKKKRNLWLYDHTQRAKSKIFPVLTEESGALGDFSLLNKRD